jgi:hypothetical protein
VGKSVDGDHLNLDTETTNHTVIAGAGEQMSDSFESIQLIAIEHGWRIEQQGEKFYLRSLEPEPFRDSEATISSKPTNHLAFFKSLAELRRFLTGE